MPSSEGCRHPDHTEGVYCHDRAVACSPDCYCCMEIPPMPSPDPLTPADLRPGQRVRITRRSRGGTYITDGTVVLADAESVAFHDHWRHWTFPATPPAGFTQTIEVIE